MGLPALAPWVGGTGDLGTAPPWPAVGAGLLVALAVWAAGRLLERLDARFHAQELRRIEAFLGQELEVEHGWVTWVYAGLNEESRALYRQVARRERFVGRFLRLEVGERAEGHPGDGWPGDGPLYGHRLILHFDTEEGSRTVWVDGFGGVEVEEGTLRVLQCGSDPYLLRLRTADRRTALAPRQRPPA